MTELGRMLREDGREEGREEGQLKKIIILIQKKLEKGLDIATIAEHVEEPAEFVEKICRIIEDKPNANIEEILEKVEKSR